MKTLKMYVTAAILFIATIALIACDKDDAPIENEEETITDVKLIFKDTPDFSEVIEARAQDPDGDGVQELVVLDEINLNTNTTYVLTFEIMNNLSTLGTDIGLEIDEEALDHQFFFSFTNNAFGDPLGNGNIDNYADSLDYADIDIHGRPVGLKSYWETSSTQLTGGTFTVRLQHLPSIKSSTSSATDGDTDFELQFVLNIQ